MDLAIIFWAIIVIGAISLAFILIKGILKAAMISLVIIFVVLAASAFFIIKDVSDLKDNLMTGDKLMVLKEKNNVLSAFSFKNLSGSEGLKNEDSQTIRDSVAKGDFSALTGNYYKVFVFEYSAFNQSLENGISFEAEGKGIILSKDDVHEILTSDAPLDIILYKMGVPDAQKDMAINEFMQNLKITSQEGIKSYIFAMMIQDIIKDEGPTKLIILLKKNEIRVYPNTAVFRAIKLVPSFFIEKFTSKMDAPAGG